MPWWGWLIFWFALSVPASLLAGAWLRACRELDEEQLQREGTMTRKWIKTDGFEQDLGFRMTVDVACKLIEADAVKTVVIDREHVVLFDESAAEGGLRNARASDLAGMEIFGHAVIAPDSDFEIQRGRRGEPR